MEAERETCVSHNNNACEETGDVPNVEIASCLGDDTGTSAQNVQEDATDNEQTNKVMEQSVFNVEMSSIPKVTTEEVSR